MKKESKLTDEKSWLNINIERILIIISLISLPAYSMAQSPEFTSTPIKNGVVGEHYEYKITTKGWWFLSRKIFVSDGKLPEGLKFKDFGDGSAILEGKPKETGSYVIELTVRLENGNNDSDDDDDRDDDDDDDRYTANSDKQRFTLVISRPVARITLSDMTTTFDGEPHVPKVTTDPKGLDVRITYEGSSSPPTDAGEYEVKAIIDGEKYDGSTTGTLTIKKAEGSIDLKNMTSTYNGKSQQVTATTQPSGLSVNITYNGSSTPPVNAGEYKVEASINNKNYMGSSSGTMTINKVQVAITLGNLTAVFDGEPKVVTATTSPPDLPVKITYNGSNNAPSAIGNYEIKAVVSETNYKGTSWGTLVIRNEGDLNNRPVISNIETAPLYYIEDEPAVSVSGTLVIKDADDANMAKAVVTINGNYVKGEDVLQYDRANTNISGEFDAERGAMTLTGADTRLHYEEAISNILYSNKGGNTNTTGKRIMFMVYDGTYFSEAVEREVLVVRDGEDIAGRPVISNVEAEPLNYYQGDPRMSVSETVIVNDIDDTHMTEAKVTLTRNYVKGEDILQFNNDLNLNISGAFDAETGVMTLIGEDTRSNYEIALRNVFYKNMVMGESTTLNKELAIAVTDGTLYSEAVTREINITVFPELDIVNAFTPNGDNINDLWNFVDLDTYASIAISVYNKEGKKVFSCFEYDCAWDGRYGGKLLPADVYFYAIELDNGKRKYRGSVTLLR